jgi:hypothetical protein
VCVADLSEASSNGKLGSWRSRWTGVLDFEVDFD